MNPYHAKFKFTYALKIWGLMHLRKISTHVSLRRLRRLTWADTFRYLFIFCMSKNHSASRFSRLFDKYRICHELTVEIEFIERVLKNVKMLLSEPLTSLITFFKTILTKFYHNSQRMSDSFYHITESSELDCKIKVQNMLI